MKSWFLTRFVSWGVVAFGLSRGHAYKCSLEVWYASDPGSRSYGAGCAKTRETSIFGESSVEGAQGIVRTFWDRHRVREGHISPKVYTVRSYWHLFCAACSLWGFFGHRDSDCVGGKCEIVEKKTLNKVLWVIRRSRSRICIQISRPLPCAPANRSFVNWNSWVFELYPSPLRPIWRESRIGWKPYFGIMKNGSCSRHMRTLLALMDALAGFLVTFPPFLIIFGKVSIFEQQYRHFNKIFFSFLNDKR